MSDEIKSEIRKFKVTLYLWSFVILVICVLSFILSSYLIRFGNDLRWWEEKVIELRDEVKLLKNDIKNIKAEEM